jgi:hypothetical protein
MAIPQVTFVVGVFNPHDESIPKAGVFNTFHRLSNKYPVT